MNEELKIYWWTDFCNKCKSEDCKNCEKPAFELGTGKLLHSPSRFNPLV